MIFKNKDLPGPQQARVKATQEYHKWRAMIFTIGPEQVGVSPSEPDRVYGVIMDIGMIDPPSATNWAISLTAFSTGEASFHPTPGGSVVGLGNDPQIGQVAQDIVNIAQNLLPQTTRSQDFSLPEPGYVQFFFLTTSGVRGVKDHLTKLQRPGDAFASLLERFGAIRQFADRILDEKKADSRANNKPSQLKGLYILAFTPEKLDSKALLATSRLAGDRLETQEPVFKQLMKEQMRPQTPIEIAHQLYVASIHTPQAMQSAMKGWLETKYKIRFNPIDGRNFFLYEKRDPQGKTNYVMFYFDLEEA